MRLLPVSDDQRVWSKSSRFLAAVADGIFEAQYDENRFDRSIHLPFASRSCLTSSDAAATPSLSPSSLNSRRESLRSLLFRLSKTVFRRRVDLLSARRFQRVRRRDVEANGNGTDSSISYGGNGWMVPFS